MRGTVTDIGGRGGMSKVGSTAARKEAAGPLMPPNTPRVLAVGTVGTGPRWASAVEAAAGTPKAVGPEASEERSCKRV